MNAITDTIAQGTWDATVRIAREALMTASHEDLMATIAHCDSMIAMYADMATRLRAIEIGGDPATEAAMDAALEALGLTLSDVLVSAETHEQSAMHWRAQAVGAGQAYAARYDNDLAGV